MVSGLSPAGTFSAIGLARLCRSSRLQAPSASAVQPRRMQLAWKREDIEHASSSGFARQVLDGIDEAERCGRVAGIELAGDDRSGPAADPGDDGNVLAPVG